jgi:hypothetical protein
VASIYEYRLKRVLERLKVDWYDFNWNRRGCFIEFRYKGELYRIDHNVEKARARGIKLQNGLEAFAEVILTLEDLAKIVERGICDLNSWVAGLKQPTPEKES